MPRNTSNTKGKATTEYDVKFKLIIIGETTVGKSCITQRLVDEEFAVNMISTIGLDFVRKTFQVEDSAVMLDIWDTAGQERFHSITTSSFRGAKGIILVYDVTNKESFRKIRAYWLKSLENNLEDPIPMFLIGNKIDLKDQREVPTSEGETLKEQQYFNEFYETSAKTGENVQEAFQQIAATLAGSWGLPKGLRRERKSIKLHDRTAITATARVAEEKGQKHLCCK